jgi:hypothetical protein
VFKYLATLDEYEILMTSKGFDVSNGVRAAVLMSAMAFEEKKDGAARKVMQIMSTHLKIPKATYFTAVLLIESTKRFQSVPTKGKQRFIYNRHFLDALDYNRIILRTNRQSETVLNKWSDLYDAKGKINEP